MTLPKKNLKCPTHEVELESPEDLQITLPDWMQSDDKTAEDLAPAARSASIPDWLEELKPAAEIEQQDFISSCRLIGC